MTRVDLSRLDTSHAAALYERRRETTDTNDPAAVYTSAFRYPDVRAAAGPDECPPDCPYCTNDSGLIG